MKQEQVYKNTRGILPVMSRALKYILNTKSHLENGLTWASTFANTTMLNILKPFSNNLPVPLLDEMMEEAVKSDSMEAVTIVKDILSDHHHRVSQDTITTARSRGLVGIIKSLDPEFEDTSEQQKQALKQAVLDKTASIEGN